MINVSCGNILHSHSTYTIPEKLRTLSTLCPLMKHIYKRFNTSLYQWDHLQYVYIQGIVSAAAA